MTVVGFMFAVALSLVLVGPVVAGLLIVRSERRGRAPEAACGGCRYPVAALVGTTPRCPECGALFSEVGILAPRRRRPALIVLAVALICVPILFLGFAVAANLAFEARVEARRAAEQAAAVRAAAAQIAADLKSLEALEAKRRSLEQGR